MSGPRYMSQKSSASVAGDESAAWLDAARELVHRCMCATPLSQYEPLVSASGDGDGSLPRQSLVNALRAFESDAARWDLAAKSASDLLGRLELAPNLLATFFYRLNHELYKEGIEFIPDVLAAVSRMLTGTEIYYSAEIGPGFKLMHGLGTTIAARCRIGSRFTVYQGVTIGDKVGKGTGSRPEIGDDVIVSAGAKVLGPIKIGDRTVIGANAVVIRSLPSRCIAVGIPAEIIRSRISDQQFEDFAAAVAVGKLPV